MGGIVAARTGCGICKSLALREDFSEFESPQCLCISIELSGRFPEPLGSSSLPLAVVRLRTLRGATSWELVSFQCSVAFRSGV